MTCIEDDRDEALWIAKGVVVTLGLMMNVTLIHLLTAQGRLVDNHSERTLISLALVLFSQMMG